VNSLRILIADDHEVARRGIRFLLEPHPGWEICGEAKDGREAVEMAGTDISLYAHFDSDDA
jgi:DNA-binding NarL/FixJ family response regulator